MSNGYIFGEREVEPREKVASINSYFMRIEGRKTIRKDNNVGYNYNTLQKCQPLSTLLVRERQFFSIIYKQLILRATFHKKAARPRIRQ